VVRNVGFPEMWAILSINGDLVERGVCGRLCRGLCRRRGSGPFQRVGGGGEIGFALGWGVGGVSINEADGGFIGRNLVSVT